MSINFETKKEGSPPCIPPDHFPVDMEDPTKKAELEENTNMPLATSFSIYDVLPQPSTRSVKWSELTNGKHGWAIIPFTTHSDSLFIGEWMQAQCLVSYGTAP
jgi:hypothetical protein